MALNTRQLASYQHRFSVIKVARTIGAGGVPSAETYSAGPSNRPGLFIHTPNLDHTVRGAGRMRQEIIYTTDQLHMEVGIDVDDTDYLKDTSLTSTGAATAANGTYYRVAGKPSVLPDAGNRRGNKQMVMLIEQEKPPAGVTAIY